MPKMLTLNHPTMMCAVHTDYLHNNKHLLSYWRCPQTPTDSSRHTPSLSDRQKVCHVALFGCRDGGDESDFWASILLRSKRFYCVSQRCGHARYRCTFRLFGVLSHLEKASVHLITLCRLFANGHCPLIDMASIILNTGSIG